LGPSTTDPRQNHFGSRSMHDGNPTLTRRAFLGSTAALAAATSGGLGRVLAAEAGKPDSCFGGVQIGTITYSYRSMPGSAEDILKYVTACGISSIELMDGPAEQYAKAHGAADDPMAGFKALRKLYNDAGVAIHIIKYGNIGDGKMTDEQIDRCFQVAKAVGARGITRELDGGAAKRLGPIADKHRIWIGFHNHEQIKPDTYDGDLLSHGEYLGINLDVGHYVAGTSQSPMPMIEKHHKRIVSLHLKDRKKNKGPNMPFGQGETPVAEILQYMKKNKLAFPGDIELEYNVPKDSDPVKEVTKCVQFCKEALA
jgi:sugar phosphate isomerase/epimerase